MIAKGKSWPSSYRSWPSTGTKTVSLVLPSNTCIGHSTVGADEGDVGEEDPGSQDEEDIGYGARSGGGFTSMVSFLISH